MSPFVCPRGTNIFRYPQRGGGTIKLFVPGEQTLLIHRGGGENIFYTRGLDKHFLYTNIFFLYTGLEQIFFMLSVMIVNVSEANILSSEARRPPPGPRNLLERGVGHQAKQKTGNLSKPQPNLNLRLGLTPFLLLHHYPSHQPLPKRRILGV